MLANLLGQTHLDRQLRRVPRREEAGRRAFARDGIDLEVTFSDQDAGVYVVDRDEQETVERPLSYAAFEVTRLAARPRDT